MFLKFLHVILRSISLQSFINCYCLYW